MSQDHRRNGAAIQQSYYQQDQIIGQQEFGTGQHFFHEPTVEGYTNLYPRSQQHFTSSESTLSFDGITPVTSSDEHHYMNGVSPMNVWQNNQQQMSDNVFNPTHQQPTTSMLSSTSLPIHTNCLPSPESTNRGTPEAASHARGLSQTSSYLETPESTPYRSHVNMHTLQSQNMVVHYNSSNEITSIPSSQPSPLITFTHHTRGDSPARSDHTRHQISKKRSASSLSQSGSYFNAGEDNASSHLRPPTQPEQDEDDRDGTDPLQRNDLEVQSLEDMAQQGEKNQSLEKARQWLETTRFEPGAERQARTQYRSDRLRSRSTGARPDPTAQPILNSEPTPGPGRELDETSEYYYSSDGESQYSLTFEDHPDTMEAEMPPQQDIDQLEDEIEPLPSQFIFKKAPWKDPVQSGIPQMNARFQPESSNAAVYKFMQKAREFDSSSRRATWGTGRVRRLSEGDAASVIEPKTRHMSLTKPTIRERTTSIVNMLKRSNSKTRQSNAHEHVPIERVQSPKPMEENHAVQNSFFGLSSPTGRVKSPSISAGLAGATSAATSVAGTPTNLNVSQDSHRSGPVWNIIRRVRSRSDVHRSPRSPAGSGIGQMWYQSGGPPVPTLHSPEHEFNEHAIHVDDIAPPTEAMSSPGNAKLVKMTFPQRPANVMPDLKGFRVQITELNPKLNQQLVDRIAHDQVKRYKRLVKYKVEHAAAVADGTCQSMDKCPAVGGQPEILPPKNNARETASSSAHFRVTASTDSDGEEEATFDGIVTEAAFPEGIPLPPAKKLPARFECPLCFQVKTFQKPSDWTKHVHEDVQPFTCTFPNCHEQRSFKRKADWVRHENERHRQLERWQCTYAECTHICFRKDNFVQHLVREHKRREPKSKGRISGAPKGKGKAASLTKEEQDFWHFVDSCKHEKSSDPRAEPCKFCGNTCSSWKKLSVHVGKHMEQIAMPVLVLAKCRNVTKDTIISPVEPMQRTTLFNTDPGLMSEIHSDPRSPYTQSGGSNYPGSSANQSPYHQLQPGFAVNTFADQYTGRNFHQSLSPAQFHPQLHFVNQPTSDYDMTMYSQASLQHHIPATVSDDMGMYSQASIQDHIPVTVSNEMHYATASIDSAYVENSQYFSSPEQPYVQYGLVSSMDGMQHLTPPPTDQRYNSQVHPYAQQEQQWQ